MERKVAGKLGKKNDRETITQIDKQIERKQT
jgi:hypothetical protein